MKQLVSEIHNFHYCKTDSQYVTKRAICLDEANLTQIHAEDNHILTFAFERCITMCRYVAQHSKR